jgi:RimJ/RimL family protein N-acetyltransferase
LIKGETVHLRSFSLEDLDFLLRWNNDPAYSGEFESIEPVSLEELEVWLPKEKPGQLWYIIETAEREKVGQIVGRYQEDGSVQIGYRVTPSARGMGYCTEAAKALITYLFTTGVEKIVAEANPGNRPSIKVLEKLGFRMIEYKENAVEINGVWLEGVVYELGRG